MSACTWRQTCSSSTSRGYDHSRARLAIHSHARQDARPREPAARAAPSGAPMRGVKRDPSVARRFDAALADVPFREWLAEYYAGVYEQTLASKGAIVALFDAFHAG